MYYLLKREMEFHYAVANSDFKILKGFNAGPWCETAETALYQLTKNMANNTTFLPDKMKTDGGDTITTCTPLNISNFEELKLKYPEYFI